jgi:hypothetical protein
MDYKKICNDNLTQLSIELMDNGMPMHETACLMLDIYEVIKKHLGDEKCTK